MSTLAAEITVVIIGACIGVIKRAFALDACVYTHDACTVHLDKTTIERFRKEGIVASASRYVRHY